MEGFLRSPMVRVTVAFVFGICLRLYSPVGVIAWPAAILLAILLALYHLNLLFVSWKLRWLGGVIVYALFLTLGYELARRASDETRVIAFLSSPTGSERQPYMAELASSPELRTRSYRVRLSIRCLVSEDETVPPEPFYCLAYLPADSSAAALKEGDLLLFRAKPEPVPGPANPSEFDFRAYLAGRNIHCRCYIGAHDWKMAGHHRHVMKELAVRCRDFVIGRMERAGVRDSELALVSALLLGKTDGIGQDVRQSYSATGAMHVLSVSGLHVGIIYMVLNFLLRGLSRLRRGEWMRFALILAFIWFYALVTGFSPSVMRASMMFSILQTGKVLKNPPPVLNTLAASAFILLAANPLVITQIGFQFSYLAVAGIVAIVGPVEEAWKPSGAIAGNIYSLLVVSVAAQLATAPLSIHYFQQFPVWFLLTNLMIIPLTTVTMYLALMVLAVPVSQFAGWIGILLTSSLRMMTGSVQLVESMPGAVVSSIHLPAAETIFLYLFILFGILFLINRLRPALPLALASLVVVLCLNDVQALGRFRKNEVFVYALKNSSCIDLVHGKSCVSLASGEPAPEDVLRYSVTPNRNSLGIRSVEMIRMPFDSSVNIPGVAVEGNFIGFRGCRIFLADSLFQPAEGAAVPCDVLIVTQGFRESLENLAGTFSIGSLVLDGSLPSWQVEQLCREADVLGISYHAVSCSGCWRREF